MPSAANSALWLALAPAALTAATGLFIAQRRAPPPPLPPAGDLGTAPRAPVADVPRLRLRLMLDRHGAALLASWRRLLAAQTGHCKRLIDDRGYQQRLPWAYFFLPAGGGTTVEAAERMFKQEIERMQRDAAQYYLNAPAGTALADPAAARAAIVALLLERPPRPYRREHLFRSCLWTEYEQAPDDAATWEHPVLHHLLTLPFFRFAAAQGGGQAAPPRLRALLLPACERVRAARDLIIISLRTPAAPAAPGAAALQASLRAGLDGLATVLVDHLRWDPLLLERSALRRYMGAFELRGRSVLSLAGLNIASHLAAAGSVVAQCTLHVAGQETAAVFARTASVAFGSCSTFAAIISQGGAPGGVVTSYIAIAMGLLSDKLYAYFAASRLDVEQQQLRQQRFAQLACDAASHFSWDTSVLSACAHNEDGSLTAATLFYFTAIYLSLASLYSVYTFSRPFSWVKGIALSGLLLGMGATPIPVTVTMRWGLPPTTRLESANLRVIDPDSLPMNSLVGVTTKYEIYEATAQIAAFYLVGLSDYAMTWPLLTRSLIERTEPSEDPAKAPLIWRDFLEKDRAGKIQCALDEVFSGLELGLKTGKRGRPRDATTPDNDVIKRAGTWACTTILGPWGRTLSRWGAPDPMRVQTMLLDCFNETTHERIIFSKYHTKMTEMKMKPQVQRFLAMIAPWHVAFVHYLSARTRYADEVVRVRVPFDPDFMGISHEECEKLLEAYGRQLVKLLRGTLWPGEERVARGRFAREFLIDFQLVQPGADEDAASFVVDGWDDPVARHAFSAARVVPLDNNNNAGHDDDIITTRPSYYSRQNERSRVRFSANAPDVMQEAEQSLRAIVRLEERQRFAQQRAVQLWASPAPTIEPPRASLINVRTVQGPSFSNGSRPLPNNPEMIDRAPSASRKIIHRLPDALLMPRRVLWWTPRDDKPPLRRLLPPQPDNNNNMIPRHPVIISINDRRFSSSPLVRLEPGGVGSNNFSPIDERSLASAVAAGAVLAAPAPIQAGVALTVVVLWTGYFVGEAAARGLAMLYADTLPRAANVIYRGLGGMVRWNNDDVPPPTEPVSPQDPDDWTA